MNKLLLLGCLAILCLDMSAQTLTVRSEGEPLAYVTLLSKDPLTMATTNTRGQVALDAFKGSERIEIRLLGYEPQFLSYDVLADQNFALQLERSNVDLQQVNVSATRWRQPSRENPERITSITPQEVALQNPQTAADLLGISGEVFIQKSQLGGGSPMIRGFSTNRLLYTVDGVRMNTAIFRGGNLQNVISLDPNAIAHTEVLFGPGSVMYGSDAIGAVMAFETLDPQFSLGDEPLVTGSAMARMSTANTERSGHFDVSVGWKKWAFISSISSFNYGDLRMGSHGPEEYLRPFYVQRIDSSDVLVQNEDPQLQVPTGYEQLNIMQKVAWKPSDKLELSYAYHYSATGDVPRYDRLIRTRDGLPRSAEWYYGPQIWEMNHLSLHYKPGYGAFDELKVQLAKQRFEESRIDRDFGGDTRFIREEAVDAWSLNVDLLKNLSTRGRLFYGLEWVANEVHSSGTDVLIASGASSPGPSRYPQATWQSYAAYATYQQDLSDKLVLQLGARYNLYSLEADFSNNLDFYPFPQREAQLDNGALTGSAGMVYRPASATELSFNLSTGFRSPNVDDVGKVFDSEPGSVVVPNPNLEAEYAYNAEVSVAQVLGDRVKLDATVYYTLLDNALVRRDFSINGQDSIVYDGELSQVQAIQNAAQTTVYGLQAGVEVKLPENFYISGRVNYQEGEEELDNGSISDSRHAAPLFGVLRLGYRSARLEWQLYAMHNAEVSYDNLAEEERGKPYLYAIDANGNPYSPSWTTLNFKARYLLSDNLSVSAGMENITDRRYRPYSSGIAAPGRNFILSLEARF